MMKWSNPHAWIYIDVAGADGKVVNWAFETGRRQHAVPPWLAEGRHADRRHAYHRGLGGAEWQAGGECLERHHARWETADGGHVQQRGQGTTVIDPFTHTIDGRGATSPASFDVLNPATGAVFSQCPDATRVQLDEAVTAARRAFPPWSRLSFEERRLSLFQFAAAMRGQVEELAQLLVREQGKTLAECRKELSFVPLQIERLSSIDVAGEILRDDDQGRIELRYRPLGVVGIITPWNVPVGIAIGRIVQALYTGNTVVQKPSPYTPLATLRMGETVRKVLPPGVLNILAGGNDFGSWMTEHPGIDKISFTGSVPTGKKVLAGASSNLKRVTLELGGNDAAIVLDDVDPKAIAPQLFRAAFANCGQICVAIKRLYVPDAIYEPMCEALAEIARSIKSRGRPRPGIADGAAAEQDAVRQSRWPSWKTPAKRAAEFCAAATRSIARAISSPRRSSRILRKGRGSSTRNRSDRCSR